MTLLVLVYFWLVEFPCMGIRGDFDSKPWANWFALIFDHSVPVIVMTMEWTHNSIKVEWNRYPFYILAGYIYILILMVATYDA